MMTAVAEMLVRGGIRVKEMEIGLVDTLSMRNKENIAQWNAHSYNETRQSPLADLDCLHARQHSDGKLPISRGSAAVTS